MSGAALNWDKPGWSSEPSGHAYDGDTCSANILYSDQAIEEIDKALNSREAYLDPKGGLRTSADLDTVSLVLRNMTGPGFN